MNITNCPRCHKKYRVSESIKFFVCPYCKLENAVINCFNCKKKYKIPLRKNKISKCPQCDSVNITDNNGRVLYIFSTIRHRYL